MAERADKRTTCESWRFMQNLRRSGAGFRQTADGLQFSRTQGKTAVPSVRSFTDELVFDSNQPDREKVELAFKLTGFWLKGQQ